MSKYKIEENKDGSLSIQIKKGSFLNKIWETVCIVETQEENGKLIYGTMSSLADKILGGRVIVWNNDELVEHYGSYTTEEVSVDFLENEDSTEAIIKIINDNSDKILK
jgi:hypothetical protein